MIRLLALLASLAAAQPSAPELEHFRLLKALRASGYTCPGGRVFPPNPAEFSFDCRAWRAARAHSEDMASRRYFGHVSPDGKNPCDRSIFCSENLAAGQATAQAALDALKSSSEHCPNMLDPALNRAGIGFARVPGSPFVNYWTQAMGTDGALDASCQGGAAAQPTCADRNPACSAYRGYAGTEWCGDAQGGWAKKTAPRRAASVKLPRAPGSS